MAKNDTIKKTLTVALTLCIVCSVVVSTAAVLLKPAQISNQQLDYRRNILSAAGLLEEGKSVEEQFESVTTKIVDIDAGKYTDKFDGTNFTTRQAARESELSTNLTANEDIAGIGRRPDYVEIYLVDNGEGEHIVVLPVYGYGLWSTLYGFLALQPDLNTVVGLGFYEHGETPGLGGEVDNPRWKALWKGKKVYGEDGNVQIQVIKGTVDEGTRNAEHKVDGLSGATLTSRGVSNLVRYWLGPQGYKPFLKNLKQGEA